MIAAGGFGALVLIYLRHPGTILRAVAHVLIAMGMALTFTELVADMLGLQTTPVAVGIGLMGKAIAEAALKWAEKLDLSGVLKAKGDGA